MIAPFRAVDEQPVVVKLQQAIALFRQGDMPGAENLLTQVLLDDPGNGHALHILGLVCERRGDLDMAEQLLERAIQIEPHSRVYLNSGVVKQHRGDLDGAIATYRAAIALEPDYAEVWTNLIFALDMHPGATPALLRETREAFDRACCARLTRMSPPHQNDRDPDRRLRVGYVGADFRTSHSASQSLGWIEHHDPNAVEVFLYSTYEGDDPTAAPFRERADVWCEIGELAANELADVIREDRIDILVDVAGVSKGGRPQTFALKPAPIQVTGWGYPTGLGIQAMDYLVGDPIATPPEHADRYPEQILSLPCLMTYRPDDRLPELAAPPAARLGYRTYGYLGRAIKLGGPTLALWAELLRTDRTARLLLKSPQYADRALRARVVGALTALGVEERRIEVRDTLTSRYEHLSAHHDVDVCLDPFPHGGGVTVMDACLMGVPTVTLLGETAAGRIAASVLTAIGLDEWVTVDAGDYLEAALAPDGPSRRTIREDFLGSVVCDQQGYARAVEAAFREAWRTWCQT